MHNQKCIAIIDKEVLSLRFVGTCLIRLTVFFLLLFFSSFCCLWSWHDIDTSNSYRSSNSNNNSSRKTNYELNAQSSNYYVYILGYTETLTIRSFWSITVSIFELNSVSYILIGIMNKRKKSFYNRKTIRHSLFFFFFFL